MNKIILKEIYSHRNKKKAKILSRFFKTGKGYYGEGDIFWGLTVPISRRIALKYKDISLKEINFLLKHKVHEVRLVGILVLVHRYRSGAVGEREKIMNFYLKNTRYINNWDLVDLSASQILGEYLLNKKDKKILIRLARSKNLWEQRIAMISTFAFIRRGELAWTFKIARMFIDHQHDLIHKATGWMLRETGKKDMKALREFLDKNLFLMPRTMLRYAIERFPENVRLRYLKNIPMSDKNKQTRIMVFGTFDGLHKGHLNFFKQAKNFIKNSFLIVSIARDVNVFKIKGHKPEFNDTKRLALVKKCNLVDKAILAGKTDHLPHILKEMPDIIALGYDQKAYVENLEKDLKNKGLLVKIIRLKPYKEKIYKNNLLHAKGRSASGGKN